MRHMKPYFHHDKATVYLGMGMGGQLNLYAPAKVSGEPLLFIGDDFAQTDVEPALKD